MRFASHQSDWHRLNSYYPVWAEISEDRQPQSFPLRRPGRLPGGEDSRLNSIGPCGCLLSVIP